MSARKNLRRSQACKLPDGPKRAAGTNPRALGTSPRQKGTNPRAFAGDDTRARRRQTKHEMRRATMRAVNREFVRSPRQNERAAPVITLDDYRAGIESRRHPSTTSAGAGIRLSTSGGVSFIRSIRDELLTPEDDEPS